MKHRKFTFRFLFKETVDDMVIGEAVDVAGMRICRGNRNTLK